MSHVAIIMATYNGAQFLPQQLASIAAQTHRDWTLWATDDGSTDTTVAVLQQFGEQHSVAMLQGPRRGYGMNFLRALYNPAIAADYVCFSDQDDGWYPDKLARALARMHAQPPDMPVLYGSRTRYVDATGHPLGLSARFTRPFGFRNALVQSFAGGNTMMLNRAAVAVLRQAPVDAITSHDWWVYQLISGAGGRILYDPEPTLDYRQHGANLAGSNRGIARSFHRVGQLMSGVFREWNDVQTAALTAHRALLTAENQRILAHFCAARKSRLPQRLTQLYSSGIYRQTQLGNAGLIVSALLNRM